MTALADAAAAFGSSLDVHEVWQRVLKETIDVLRVETACIGMLEGPEQTMVFRAAAGQAAELILDRRLTGSSGLVRQMVRDGRGLVIASAAGDPRYTDQDRFPGIQVRALAVAPIQAHGRIMGVLQAINPASNTFDRDALTVMMGLGGLAGTTIRNAQLYEQLQQAHRRYRELFDESIDPIFVTDWDGRITEANRRAADLSGYDTDALRSMNVDQLHQVDWNRVGMGFSNLREMGRPTYESFLQTADSRRIPIEVHARRVEFEAADSILWTVRDITQRKELDAFRQDLSSMIYHDLRSPLGNVVSSLGMLEGMLGTDAGARSMLDIAVRSADRMHRLVNALLDIDRLEAGQPVGTRTAVSPKELVLKAVEDASPEADAHQHVIRTRIPPELPSVSVDEDMIRRVLINLLENAIKFCRDASEIEIGVRSEDSALQFWVQDQGPGIPAAERQRIFEKFTRLADGVQRPSGLGIGLAFCQLAVRAHGGEIRVESREGGGSRFVFLLPTKAPTI
jgi:PAS domain S-box-containing protein